MCLNVVSKKANGKVGRFGLDTLKIYQYWSDLVGLGHFVLFMGSLMCINIFA